MFENPRRALDAGFYLVDWRESAVFSESRFIVPINLLKPQVIEIRPGFAPVSMSIWNGYVGT